MILGSSAPGIPVELEVITPGRLPVKACPKLVTPPVRSKVLELVCAMAPTTEAFFCWPKPTTTTSSSCWLSSSKITLIGFWTVAFTSCDFIPINETTRVTLSLGTANVKFPSISDIVPIEVLPFTTMEAPITVSPVPSRTVPFTVTPFCAKVGKQLNSNKTSR